MYAELTFNISGLMGIPLYCVKGKAFRNQGPWTIKSLKETVHKNTGENQAPKENLQEALDMKR